MSSLRAREQSNSMLVSFRPGLWTSKRPGAACERSQDIKCVLLISVESGVIGYRPKPRNCLIASICGLAIPFIKASFSAIVKGESKE